MPSSKKAIKQMVELAEGSVVELGCGWGGLAKALQKKGLKVSAYEVSFLPYLVSKLRGVNVKRRDFFKEDLSSFDTVVCYLYPGAMRRLTHLKNSRLITNTFAVPGWKAAKVFVLHDLYRSEVTLYHPCGVLGE
ncbi:MAG: SAM-dependent methyltransferase [Chlamydiales bacterium]|nr:SAM-dependent methyltransferase [Chlamydiales bacterium]